MKMKTVTPKEMTLLPPQPHLCQVCAVDHEPEFPHDATSFYYQFKFNMENKRGVTWRDAMVHCTEEMKSTWTQKMIERGIDITSTNTRGKN